jgi:hypothetical protein
MELLAHYKRRAKPGKEEETIKQYLDKKDKINEQTALHIGIFISRQSDIIYNFFR